MSEKTKVELAKEIISQTVGEGGYQDVSVVQNGEKVVFNLLMEDPSSPKRQEIIDNVTARLKEHDFKDIDVYTTKAPAQGAPSGGGHRPIGGTADRGQIAPKSPVEGVKHIIAVNSGKGGVGKTTCSVNLAIALSQLGNKVGLLDADITGPNGHLMLGITEKPTLNEERKVVPLEAYGIKLISMGTFVNENKPTIWRGPMLDGVIKQFLREVDWGEIDYLVVDLPPGTSDAQLTLCQNVPLSGVVTVTTPQDVALLDAKKGYQMFEKMQIPMLGIIENMSFFECPKCSEKTEIFSHGGGHKAAEELNIEFLGEIPIELKVRTGGDEGKPITAVDSEHGISKAFKAIAEKVVEKVAAVAV